MWVKPKDQATLNVKHVVAVQVGLNEERLEGFPELRWWIGSKGHVGAGGRSDAHQLGWLQWRVNMLICKLGHILAENQCLHGDGGERGAGASSPIRPIRQSN